MPERGTYLKSWSNIKIAQQKAIEYLGTDAILYPSTKKDKKYMILDPNNKWVHFGFFGMEDHTKNKRSTRRRLYLARATKIKGNWKDNPYSPNNLSIHILW